MAKRQKARKLTTMELGEMVDALLDKLHQKELRARPWLTRTDLVREIIVERATRA